MFWTKLLNPLNPFLKGVSVLFFFYILSPSLKANSGADSLTIALDLKRIPQEIGFSTQMLTHDDILPTYQLNPLKALSGKVAGLSVQGQNFGGTTRLRLRGNSSIYGNNQPLIVLDGIPLNSHSFSTFRLQDGNGGFDYGTLNVDLNSFDISSVQVLKGAFASSLYGSRGQNGVIMLSSNSNQELQKGYNLQINTGITFERIDMIPAMQNLYGGGLGDFQTTMLNGKAYQTPYYAWTESWGPKYNTNTQVLPWWGLANYEDGLNQSYQTTPWVPTSSDVDQFYETGITWHNAFLMHWNLEKSILQLNITSVLEKGTMPNSKRIKNNITWSSNTRFLQDKLNLRTSLFFIHNQTQGRPMLGADNQSTTRMFYQYGQRQLNMDKLKDYQFSDGTQRAWNRISVYEPFPSRFDNPYWIAYKNYQQDIRLRSIMSVGLNYKFSRNLNFDTQISLDTYGYTQKEQIAQGSRLRAYKGEAKHQSSTFQSDNKLSYHSNFKGASIRAMLGASYRNDIYSYQLDEQSNLSSAVSDTAGLLYSWTDSKFQELSWYANLGLSWDFGLHLDLNYRNDYQNIWNKTNNWVNTTYAGVGANWDISQSFQQASLPFINLFANLGQAGGTHLTASRLEKRSNTNVKPWNTIWDPLVITSDLIPEKTTEFETGLRYHTKHNRLGTEIAYYTRNTENQLLPVIEGDYQSITSYTNSGSVNNSGVEISFWVMPVVQKHVRWQLAANFSKNNNTVKALNGTNKTMEVAAPPLRGAVINASEGYATNQLYAYDYVYSKTGQRVVNEATGFYKRSDELVPVGSSEPDMLVSLNNTFKIKSFEFNVLLDGQIGGKYYSLTKMYGMYSGISPNSATPTSNGNTIREDGIIVDGVILEYDENNQLIGSRPNDIRITGIQYARKYNHTNGTPSINSVFESTYFTFREVSLKYRLPKLFKNVSKINASLYARNILTFGLDQNDLAPESIINGSGNTPSIEGAMYPHSLSFGCNLNFVF